MKDFRNQIERRKSFLMIITGFIVILNGGLYYLDNHYVKSGNGLSATLGFQMGLILGLSLLAIFGIYKYSHALKDDTALKQLYISEHDERNALIKEKMAKSVLVVGFILTLIAISVSIYYQPIIAMTLIVALYVMVILALLFKVYYRHKY